MLWIRLYLKVRCQKLFDDLSNCHLFLVLEGTFGILAFTSNAYHISGLHKSDVYLEQQTLVTSILVCERTLAQNQDFLVDRMDVDRLYGVRPAHLPRVYLLTLADIEFDQF